MKNVLLILMLWPVLLLGDTKVVVHNRVLAHVNGKTISVIDLMKKMDMILFQNYPQYLEVPEARFQFYTAHWKQILSEWVDRELVLADAEERKFEVTSGDVREELEEVFGPSVMINLDSAGLTYDDAFKLLKDEITIRRMLFMQVRGPVHQQVTPSLVRKAFDEHVAKIGDQKGCTWSAISVKASDQKEASDYAKSIYTYVSAHNRAPDLDDIKKNVAEKESITITVSAPFQQKLSELTPTLQELFSTMKIGSYSPPLEQSSRSGQVTRIYYLHDRATAALPTIESLEATLREEITQKLEHERTESYYQDLRRHFHVAKEEIEKELPTNFQPFEMNAAL